MSQSFLFSCCKGSDQVWITLYPMILVQINNSLYPFGLTEGIVIANSNSTVFSFIHLVSLTTSNFKTNKRFSLALLVLAILLFSLRYKYISATYNWNQIYQIPSFFSKKKKDPYVPITTSVSSHKYFKGDQRRVIKSDSE